MIMTSERQRDANRRNAINSTGPKTPAGKAVVRFNAVRHGVRAAAVVVPGLESAEEWDQFRTGVRTSLKPEGVLEEALADRAAGLLWRLGRLERFDSLSVAADQAALEIPARPPDRDGGGSGLTRQVHTVTDEDRLNALEAKLAPAQARVAKYSPARDLAGRLAEMDPGAQIDPAAAVALVSVCAKYAADRSDDVEVPDQDDPDGLLAAAGLPAGASLLDAPWTAGAALKAVSTIAASVRGKATSPRFLAEVTGWLGRRLAKAEAVIQQCTPDVAVLRKRVNMNRAVARARRVVADEAAVTKIARYEGHLQRQLTATLAELERLQRWREATSPPD